MDYTGSLLGWTTRWDSFLWFSVPMRGLELRFTSPYLTNNEAANDRLY